MSVVSVRDLVVEYRTEQGAYPALHGVSLDVEAGEVMALIGESGSGKSTLAMSIGWLLHRSAVLVSGAIFIDAAPVHALRGDDLLAMRAKSLAYVFQDPVGSLDPTKTIGRQVEWVLRDCGSTISAEETLEPMRFADVRQVLSSYPHQISGGMAQRVAIAMALARSPEILIADEPTAALDASIRTELLDLLTRECRRRRVALLVATHDLDLVQRFADRAAVMYAGRVVESGDAVAVLSSPEHPYTRALLKAAIGREAPGERLSPIPGMPTTGEQPGCAFRERCRFAVANCGDHYPPDMIVAGQTITCHRAGTLDDGSVTP
jgi:oligopeptide/dipeptide ABC transporter ATP-binding protein